MDAMGTDAGMGLEDALRDYRQRWPLEEASVALFLELLGEGAEAFRRERLVGHFTGGVWLAQGLVAARLAPNAVVPSAQTVQVELSAGATRIALHWPLAHTGELAAFVREIAR